MNPVIPLLAARLGGFSRSAPSGSEPSGSPGRCLPIAGICGCSLLLVACKDGQPPQMPDLSPIGNGLSTLGYAILGAAVVLTLGRLIRI